MANLTRHYARMLAAFGYSLKGHKLEPKRPNVALRKARKKAQRRARRVNRLKAA